MHVPTTSELLQVWEQGLHQGSLHRALGLVALAAPELEPQALAELSIGQRDRKLFELRQLLFGSRLTSMTYCPQCAERLEWESNLADFALADEQPSNKEFQCDLESYRFKFRLPNSQDLVALTDRETKCLDSRMALLERCLIEAQSSDGERRELVELPESALQTLSAEMERLDPQANVQFSLSCPGCGHGWECVFDIVSFLWTELNSWAERTLRAVHVLARTYGWGEQDILAMSPIRKQLYLDMALQ